MGKEIITFDDVDVEKYKFYHYNSSIFLEDVDIENLLASGKIASSEKKL